MRDIDKADPALLSKMMGSGLGDQPVWQPEELAAILRHQMSAAVQFDLGALDAGLAGRLSKLSSSQGLLLKSFADLFFHPHPPLELLRLTKEFAKAHKNHPDSPLPDEVATLLYFLSIVAARVRCGERITQLDDEALGRGIKRLLAQAWIDEKTRALLLEGLACLKGKAGGPR